MDTKRVEHYRDQLIHLRSRTRDELNRMIDVVLDDAQPFGEHDRQTSESVEKEILLESAEESLRRQVTDALDRIADGSFGLCQDCGKAITKTRLDALPYTSYCVACEAKHEVSRR
ncbi:MAG: TraR/DksA family transcriptional regulator [Planctomycetales bacterium]|nr:TraR/DksA family transcriptional regulator [Planctomycetales bacterium]